MTIFPFCYGNRKGFSQNKKNNSIKSGFQKGRNRVDSPEDILKHVNVNFSFDVVEQTVLNSQFYHTVRILKSNETNFKRYAQRRLNVRKL